jgi:hypothetical protein
MSDRIKILYNDCYGGFDFSDEFKKEYTKRTGKEIQDTWGPNKTLRMDPVIVALVEEKGTEWSSASHAVLAIRRIPAIFASYWDIHEYDGNETIHVDVNAALADCLETFMETGDRAALDRQYAAICAARGKIWETLDAAQSDSGVSSASVPVSGMARETAEG